MPSSSGSAMMLAKLSEMSKTTHSSKVTTPAITSGTSVNSTSPTRRSAINSSRAIRLNAKAPASIKERTTVLPAANSSTAGPLACGSAANTAFTKLRTVWLSSGSPFGRISMRARPSAAIQSRAISAGMVSREMRSGLSEGPFNPLSINRAAFRKFPQQAGKSSRRFRPRPGLIAGRPGESVSSRQKSPHAVLIVRRGDRFAGIEGPAEGGTGIIDKLEFCVLIVGYEGAERPHLCDLRKPRDAVRCCICCLQIICDDVDSVGAGGGVLSQPIISCHRLDGGVPQMHGIEVEPKVQQQRGCQSNDQNSKDDDRHAMPVQKPVDRCKGRKADGMGFCRRFDDGQKRGKHRYADRKSDQHADARNHSKLGEATVVRGQERAEAHRCRNCGQRQGQSRFPSGAPQSVLEARMVMALCTIADTELEPKVDAEADEKHKKGN